MMAKRDRRQASGKKKKEAPLREMHESYVLDIKPPTGEDDPLPEQVEDEVANGSREGAARSDSSEASSHEGSNDAAIDSENNTATANTANKSAFDSESAVTVEIQVVQQMDFRMPSETPKGKPSWSSNPAAMSFLSSLTGSALPSSCKQYPTWLAQFMLTEHSYADSACIRLNDEAAVTSSADSSNPKKIPNTNESSEKDSFAEEVTRALEPLIATAPEPHKTEPAFRIDSEHIIIEREDDDDVDLSRMNISDLKAWLFYEASLRQWLVIYEFTLTTHEQRLISLLEAARTLHPEQSDLYNVIRGMFVASTRSDTTINAVKAMQRKAKVEAAHLCKRLYGLKKSIGAEDLFVFPKSRTNISFFIGSNDPSDLTEPLIRESEIAEAKRGSVIDVIAHRPNLTNDSLADVWLMRIGGRFNTVLIDESSDLFDRSYDIDASCVVRFMPMIFHGTLMRAYLDRMSNTMRSIERKVLSGTKANARERNAYISSLINSIEYASLENETFRRDVEQDSELIHARIEQRWNIERSLERLKEFTGGLSSYLDRDHKKRVRRSWRKAIIALVVILALGALAFFGIKEGFFASLSALFTGEPFGNPFEDLPFEFDLSGFDPIGALLEIDVVAQLVANIETMGVFGVLIPLAALFIIILAIVCIVRLFRK